MINEIVPRFWRKLSVALAAGFFVFSLVYYLVVNAQVQQIHTEHIQALEQAVSTAMQGDPHEPGRVVPK